MTFSASLTVRTKIDHLAVLITCHFDPAEVFFSNANSVVSDDYMLENKWSGP